MVLRNSDGCIKRLKSRRARDLEDVGGNELTMK